MGQQSMDPNKADNPEISADGSLFAVSDVLVRAMERINARAENHGTVTGIGTGFHELDGIIGGFRGCELVVIGGRPSMGKTTLALGITEHLACEANKTVLYASLDLHELDLMDRLLSSRSLVDGQRIRTGKWLRNEDMAALDRAYHDLRRAPLWILSPAYATVAQIAADARRLVSRAGLDLIVVDTLQLIEPENPQERRPHQLARICRQLKQLARELNVPVVALSQLSQRLEYREEHRPRMGDLLVGRAFDAEADVILFLHRPEYFDPKDQPGLAELIVVRNSRGVTDTVKLAFRREFPRFDNLASRDAEILDGYF
jgi:replicative DNA helicase